MKFFQNIICLLNLSQYQYGWFIWNWLVKELKY